MNTRKKPVRKLRRSVHPGMTSEQYAWNVALLLSVFRHRYWKVPS